VNVTSAEVKEIRDESRGGDKNDQEAGRTKEEAGTGRIKSQRQATMCPNLRAFRVLLV
jgi:hypothetical protein